MNVKKLFLLRHAKPFYGLENPGLGVPGKEQSRELADLLKNNLIGIPNSDITIWTSASRDAVETSLIILDVFPDSDFAVYKKLGDGIKNDWDFDWLIEKLDNFDGQILIIVSHLEYVQRFPRVLEFLENSSDYAQGVLIENGRCSNFYSY